MVYEVVHPKCYLVCLVAMSAGARMRLDCQWRVVKASDGSEADGSESRVGVNVRSTPCMEGQRGQDVIKTAVDQVKADEECKSRRLGSGSART